MSEQTIREIVGTLAEAVNLDTKIGCVYGSIIYRKMRPQKMYLQDRPIANKNYVQEDRQI